MNNIVNRLTSYAVKAIRDHCNRKVNSYKISLMFKIGQHSCRTDSRRKYLQNRFKNENCES